MPTLDLFEPERLRAFVMVAQTRSFTRAAERLHLAQPTVSQQVRRLEEAVGRALFDRSAGAVELTPDGEVLLGYAREMLALASRARLQFSAPPLAGSVRLGLVDDVNLTALPEILGELHRLHPRFELFVGTGTTANLATQVQDRTLDLALTKRVVGSSEGEYLATQRMVWVGDPRVLERESGVVPLVTTPPGTIMREIVLEALRPTTRQPSIRFEAATITGLRAGVLAGLGIAAFSVGMVPPGLARLPQNAGLPPLPDVEFVLVVNPHSADPVVATFAALLRDLAPSVIGRLAAEQGAELG